MNYDVSEKNINEIFLVEEDRTSSILQNVLTIISTFKNTVPLYREFGISADHIDKPISVAKSMLAMEIHEAIERFEPRASFESIRFYIEPDKPGTLKPIVEVSIKDE